MAGDRLSSGRVGVGPAEQDLLPAGRPELRIRRWTVPQFGQDA